MTRVNIDQNHDAIEVRRSYETDIEPLPVVVERVEPVHYEYVDTDTAYLFSLRKVDRIVLFVAIILETLIAFRIFLKLIAANPESGFASFIYNTTNLFLLPFAGLTATPSANGAVLEVSSIIAMIAYAVLFWLIVYVIHLFWD